MFACPRCNHNRQTICWKIGVWSAIGNPNYIGLGTVDQYGEICCSFREGEFKTVEEAKNAAQETSIEEVYNDYGC